MSREAFANELYNIIQESGIRKTIIAQALGMSSSALSQFIHGTALPRPEQLNEILLLLCVPDTGCATLHRLLNLAIEEAGENWEAETIDWDEQTAADDDENGDDQEQNDQKNFNKLFKEYDDELRQAPLIFAELNETGIPIVDLFTLNGMDKGMNLYEYAMLNVHDTAIRDYGSLGSPVIIKTAGCLVGLNYPGPVQLVVSQDTPHSFSALTLEAYTDGSYQVILHEGERDFNHLESLFSKPRRNVSRKKKWDATVLEFTITPLHIDGNAGR
ncbi:MAG: helix-turn-helix transcriptional regulator [Lentisphaeria bacterium]|nr:helix-turn-helix transcriptional regulator [Lentisphaeria bacterium]